MKRSFRLNCQISLVSVHFLLFEKIERSTPGGGNVVEMSTRPVMSKGPPPLGQVREARELSHFLLFYNSRFPSNGNLTSKLTPSGSFTFSYDPFN
ncbi:MAG: hypothetical protein QMD88_09095 [Coprothermobacterota bacterium]|nr:hypothetical protein [Coprothermobacterota bacterium]